MKQSAEGRCWKIDALAGICSAVWIGLAFASHFQTQVSVGLFVAIMAIAWAATIAGLRLSRQLPARSVLLRVWVWALVFRAIGLFAVPVFEDDYFRYLWDGFVFSETGNPYGSVPADYFGDPSVPDAMASVLSSVNHPDLSTIYGPVAQWGFRLSHWVAPGEVWPWKLLLIGAEMMTLFLLLKIVAPAQALLFAWCPLLVHETAFNAHPEAIGVLALVAALVFLKRNQVMPAALAFVIAAAVKPIGGLLIPLVLWRKGWRPWVVVLASIIVLWGPFVFSEGAGEWSALLVFARDWEFNSSIFGLLTALSNRAAASVICAVGLAAAYVALVLRAHRRSGVNTDVPEGEFAYGALFLLSPVVNPWYLAWLIPFVVCRPSRIAMAALAASSLSYLHGMNLGDSLLSLYEHPAWLRPLEYGIVAVTALVTARASIARVLSSRVASTVRFAR